MKLDFGMKSAVKFITFAVSLQQKTNKLTAREIEKQNKI